MVIMIKIEIVKQENLVEKKENEIRNGIKEDKDYKKFREKKEIVVYEEFLVFLKIQQKEHIPKQDYILYNVPLLHM